MKLLYRVFDILGWRRQDHPMPYLTTNEVTQRTGWTRAWVSSLFNRGKLRGTKTAQGLLLIDEQSLDEYLAAPPDKGGRPRKPKYQRGTG